MSTTFGTLKTRALLLLGDDVVVTGTGGSAITSGSNNSADLLTAAVAAALDAILPWYWKRKTLALTGGSTVYGLASDHWRMEAVLDLQSGKFLPTVLPSVSNSWGEGYMDNNGWLEYPSGSITFSASIPTDGATIYYHALWVKPVYDTDNLEVPDFLVAALCFYVASYCCVPKAYNSANIRQYGTRVDSGTPEDNPLMSMSNNYMKRFELEMSRVPISARGEK